jgi:hypothetical protein
VPARDTVCGLLGALSVIFKVAARGPAEVGANVRLIVQLLFAANEDPQLLDLMPKSPGFAPTTATLLMVSWTLPVLLKVTDCAVLLVPTAWLPKFRLDGETPPTVPVPVPAKVTDCVLPATPLLLSVIVRVPLTAPMAVGEKDTLIVQEPPVATLPPQVLVSLKLAVVEMIEIVSVVLPVFLRVTGCDTLVVPTPCPLNVRLGGETPATGAVPVPVNLTVCVLPPTPLLLSVMVRVPVRVPVAVGEKLTLIVQEPLTATLPPQVLVSPKFAVVAMLEIVSAPLPVLLRVTGCDTLVVPTT